jgi:hypothetical protein
MSASGPSRPATMVRSLRIHCRCHQPGSESAWPAPRMPLDFGCGCGRVIRWLRGIPADLRGADFDRDAIAWCRKNLSFAKFERNRLAPPLPCEPESFDLSAAQHMSRGGSRRWEGRLQSRRRRRTWRKPLDPWPPLPRPLASYCLDSRPHGVSGRTRAVGRGLTRHQSRCRTHSAALHGDVSRAVRSPRPCEPFRERGGHGALAGTPFRS